MGTQPALHPERMLLPLGAPRDSCPPDTRRLLPVAGKTIASNGNYFHTAAQEGTNSALAGPQRRRKAEPFFWRSPPSPPRRGQIWGGPAAAVSNISTARQD